MAKIQEKNQKLGEDERQFSMVLVGHDDSAEGVASYLKNSKLGIPAVKSPIGELKYGEPLTDLVTTGYESAIPALLLLDKNGKLVSRDAREVMVKLNKMARGKSKRVKEREARAAKKAAAEAAEKKK